MSDERILPGDLGEWPMADAALFLGFPSVEALRTWCTYHGIVAPRSVRNGRVRVLTPAQVLAIRWAYRTGIWRRVYGPGNDPLSESEPSAIWAK